MLKFHNFYCIASKIT